MDLQIDDFYKDCAAGMLTLYLAFPANPRCTWRT